MIFFLDADFPEKTTILESNNWNIIPLYSEEDGSIINYKVHIYMPGGYEHFYQINVDSYKRLLNAFRDNRAVTKVYLCRNKLATTDREG